MLEMIAGKLTASRRVKAMAAIQFTKKDINMTYEMNCDELLEHPKWRERRAQVWERDNWELFSV